MARIRTIKPSFWKHEDLSTLPPETHMLAAALLNYADDEGYFNANTKLVKAECCPLREDSTNIHRGLEQLSKVGYLRLGKCADGKSYGHIINFLEHQKVDRPTASKIKALSVIWEGSEIPRRELDEGSSLEGKGKEVLTPNKKHPIPADFGISERVANWAKEKGHSNLNAHLENFISAAKKHGYKYVDWDEAFMEAIRKNWAKVEASSMEFINK